MHCKHILSLQQFNTLNSCAKSSHLKQSKMQNTSLLLHSASLAPGTEWWLEMLYSLEYSQEHTRARGLHHKLYCLYAVYFISPARQENDLQTRKNIISFVILYEKCNLVRAKNLNHIENFKIQLYSGHSTIKQQFYLLTAVKIHMLWHYEFRTVLIGESKKVLFTLPFP